MEDIYSTVSIGQQIAARAKARAKELKRPMTAVLKAARLGPSFIKDIDQNPDASPRIDNIMRLAAALDWTATDLIPDDSARKRLALDEIKEAARENLKRRDALVLANEYDVQLSAGPGALITDEDPRAQWGLPRSFLEQMRLDAQQLAIVSIIGESMEPLLRDGDMVMLDLRSRNPALPGIYALWEGNATVCKRVEIVHGSDPAKLRVMSVNPAYSTYEVLAEETNVIGRVAWFGRRT